MQELTMNIATAKQEILKELQAKLVSLEAEYTTLHLEVDKAELMYRLAIYLIDTYKIDINLL